MSIQAHQYSSVGEALQAYNAGEGEAVISVDRVRGYLVTTKAEAERVAASGVGMAYLYDHEMPDGSWRTVSVPVN